MYFIRIVTLFAWHAQSVGDIIVSDEATELSTRRSVVSNDVWKLWVFVWSDVTN